MNWTLSKAFLEKEPLTKGRETSGASKRILTKEAEKEGVENFPMGRSGEKAEEKEMGVKGLKPRGVEGSRKNWSSDHTIVSEPPDLSLYRTYPDRERGSGRGRREEGAGEDGEEVPEGT